MEDKRPIKFLFICSGEEGCGCIFSIPFEDEKEIEAVREGELVLECGICRGKAIPLRD
jgi:hypothetical protein